MATAYVSLVELYESIQW